MLPPVVEDVSAEMNLNPPLKNSDVLSWGMGEFPQAVRDRIYSKFRDPKYMGSLKPYSWIIPTLQALNVKGHELMCITAREREVSTETHIFIQKTFPLISRTIFLSKQENKLPALLTYKIGIYVDDNPIVMKEAIGKGILCYLVSNEETKYNWIYRTMPGLRVIPAFDIPYLQELL
jgi:5'(3')-deoxyribonucleotidase